MKVITQVLKPEEIKIRLQADFTLGQWEEVAKVLMNKEGYSFPINELLDSIRDCTNQAKKTFYPKTEEQE